MKTLVLVLLLSSGVVAEPDSVMRYLMSEPASSLDIGIIKIKGKLHELFHSDYTHGNLHIGIFPKIKDNTLTILLVQELPVHISEEFGRDFCRNKMDMTREAFSVDSETGEGRIGGYSSLSTSLGVFERMQEVDDMTEIQIGMKNSYDRPLKTAMSRFDTTIHIEPEFNILCKGKLVGKDIFFTDQEADK